MPGSGFQNDIIFAKNADFSGSASPNIVNGLVGNMDVWMGHGSGNSVDVVRIAQGANMTITRAIVLGVDTLTFASTGGGGGGALTNLAPQTGTSPVVPTAGNIITFNGATVAAGVNPVLTNGIGPNTIQLQVQLSQAIPSTDATKVGLCNFNSSQFSVDANGFVTLLGGGEAVDSIGVDATSGTGTNPVLPTAGGLITVNGATVAAGTNPIRTVSTAPNVYQIQNQISQALAATDATKIGLSNFDSASFGVDANGFVTLKGALPPSAVSELFDDFLFNRGGPISSLDSRCYPFYLTYNSWDKTDVTNHPGVMSFTSTSSSDNPYIYSIGGGSSGINPGLYQITFEVLSNFSVLSSANPSYTNYIGMWQGGITNPGVVGVDGIWMEYTHTANGGQWVMKCSTVGSGGATTTANSTTAASTGWHRYKIVVNAAATAAHFYVDGVELANSPITTNIPTTSNPKLYLEYAISSGSGSNSKTFQVDYFYYKTEFTR